MGTLWDPCRDDQPPRCVKFPCLLLIATFITCAAGYGVAAVTPIPAPSLDRDGGFRDAKLGASRSSFRRLVKDHASEGIDYYKRQGDNLSYGDVQLESILYGFSAGVLSRIQLRTPAEKESSPCGDSARFKALRRSAEAYSDVTLAYEVRPTAPAEIAANKCRGYCAVAVYQAKKIQMLLKADEQAQREETSRRLLTSEQLSAYLRQTHAELMSEGSPVQEPLLMVNKQRLAKFQFPADGAQIYEGADRAIIGVKEVQGGRFDVITLKDVSLCYDLVEFSLAPPPSEPDDWAGKILEEMERRKKETGGQKKP